MKLLFSIFCFCFISSQTQAQSDVRLGQYDAKYYHIHIDSFSVSGKYMEAHCQINIKFLQANDSVILNLYALKVDSILLNTNKISFNQNDKKQEVYIKLPKMYQANDSIELDVFYSGTPKTISASFGGFYFNGNYAYNLGVNIDANPASFGRAWFPCLDYFEDKTSYKFHVKIDSFYKVLCNGILESVDTLTNGNLLWNWNFNQEISTYLASIAIAPYQILKSEYQNINGDNIPVYIAALAQDTSNVSKSFINLNEVIKIYEDAYGKYPFDRVGYDVVPFNGGAMEHAGNIAYPKFAVDGTLAYESLYAHELSHQWWGNWVTCKTPSDMWLNEGWASYNEILMLEKLYDKEVAKKDFNEKLYRVLRRAHLDDGNAIAISNVPAENTYGTHVYTKGATTIHTLRNYLGDDVFFDIIPKMLKNYESKNWSTADFQKEMENLTGKSLNYFFNPWIKNAGFTAVSASILKVEQKGNNFEHSVKISQRLRWAKEIFKEIPIEILFKNKSNDSTIKFTVENWDTTHIISLPFSADYIWVDADEKISDAVTTDFLKQKSIGNYALSNANTSVRIKESLTDSIEILAQQIWASPFVNNINTGMNRNANRYWSIQGNWEVKDNEKLNFTFSYDATKPTNFNNGWLDTSWIYGSEDSIVLYYRPNAGAIWEEYNLVTYDKGNLKTNFGSATLTAAKKGDYMFGMANHGLGINKLSTESLKLYPNPAKDVLKINEIEKYKSFFIYNFNGILMYSGDIENKQAINIELLESGNYILELKDNNEKSYLGKFIIQK